MDEPDHNPTSRRKAVALRYDTERDRAPKVVATGSGDLAERIIATAKEHGIHLHTDPDMIAVLSKLKPDMEIPPDLYRAVAEVLAFVYRINREHS